MWYSLAGFTSLHFLHCCGVSTGTLAGCAPLFLLTQLRQWSVTSSLYLKFLAKSRSSFTNPHFVQLLALSHASSGVSFKCQKILLPGRIAFKTAMQALHASVRSSAEVTVFSKSTNGLEYLQMLHCFTCLFDSATLPTPDVGSLSHMLVPSDLFSVQASASALSCLAPSDDRRPAAVARTNAFRLCEGLKAYFKWPGNWGRRTRPLLGG
jgi:hypothetical protein